MPTLRTSLGSPYGRKARIAILHLGLEKQVSVAPAQTSDPTDPIHTINPLHKMPALVREDGGPIYDSPVILEYLDWLAGGGRILPTDPKPRFAALTLQALADGMMEAIALERYENRWHPQAQRSDSWVAHQQKKIDGALGALERETPPRQGLDVGQIAVACALGFHDRQDPGSWRAAHPRLASWLDEFADRTPAWGATRN